MKPQEIIDGLSERGRAYYKESVQHDPGSDGHITWTKRAELMLEAARYIELAEKRREKHATKTLSS